MNAKVDFVNTFPQVDTTVVGSENTKLQQNCDDVEEKLDNAINKNKKILSDLEEYWEEEGKLKEHLKGTRTRLDENKPVVMDAAKLKEQLGRVQVRYTYIHTYFIVTSPKGLFRNNDYVTLFIITNYNT